MAGYIFLLDKESNLNEQIKGGIYSTRMSRPEKPWWSMAMESTIADYAGMRKGDNIYFFQKRKIYGLGELLEIKKQMFFENYPDSSLPSNTEYEKIEALLLLNKGVESLNSRLICFFKHAPYFFRDGVDMDDVLSSAPEKFKMLRLIQQVSFIKVDDEENQALRNIILKRSLKGLRKPDKSNVYEDFSMKVQREIANRITEEHKFKLAALLQKMVNHKGALRHEMLVELAMLYLLNTGDKNAVKVFGSWDYLSHQVGASPFKPIAYMDRIDVFGYAYIKNYRPTIERFLVVEIKADIATQTDINQLMKYVDWVKNEYADNDYEPVKAFLVANEFSGGIDVDVEHAILRNYTIGNRPTKSASWTNVKLVKYSVDEFGEMSFSLVKDFNIW